MRALNKEGWGLGKTSHFLALNFNISKMVQGQILSEFRRISQIWEPTTAK